MLSSCMCEKTDLFWASLFTTPEPHNPSLAFLHKFIPLSASSCGPPSLSQAVNRRDSMLELTVQQQRHQHQHEQFLQQHLNRQEVCMWLKQQQLLQQQLSLAALHVTVHTCCLVTTHNACALRLSLVLPPTAGQGPIPCRGLVCCV